MARASLAGVDEQRDGGGERVLLLWWRHTGKGVLEPALVHLATNSGGVLVAWFVLSSA